MAQIGTPAVPALITALKCDRLGPRSPLSGDKGPFTKEIESVRRGAANALALIGTPARAAIPALTEALRDEYPSVRERAAQALKEIQRHDGHVHR